MVVIGDRYCSYRTGEFGFFRLRRRFADKGRKDFKEEENKSLELSK